MSVIMVGAVDMYMCTSCRAWCKLTETPTNYMLKESEWKNRDDGNRQWYIS